MTPAARLSIVVEGQTDAELIRALLGKELAAQARFFATRGQISLASVGRNLLVDEGGPVLLVMDADTRNPARANELQSMAMVALSGVVPGGMASGLFKVFAFLPEIEVVYFEAPQALEQALGRKIPEETVKDGLLAPKETLARVLAEVNGKPDGHAFLLDRMNNVPHVVTMLASGNQARALRGAVESLVSLAISA